MLSRVADSLYWMSRYLERAEHTARVLGVQLNLMLEQDPKSSDRRWLRVLASLGHTGPLTEDSDPFTIAQVHALRQITPASDSRVKTPARFASRSAPKCGNSSTGCFMKSDAWNRRAYGSRSRWISWR